MKKIGIIGLGLIGGSIAKCLREKTDYDIVAMSRSEQPLIDAEKNGDISKYSLNDINIFKDCDIVFVCTSVDKIPAYVERLIPVIKKNCIITDVGSTKEVIYNEMLKFGDINFIGGHPMAGSEKTGYRSAKAHLFENAYYILTPNKNINESMLKFMLGIVRTLGAIPLVLDPSYHDHTVAAISHVPHIIAAALVNTVKDLDGDDHYMHALAAGGFKDITRIASSSPEVWASICEDNRDKILSVLSRLKENITSAEEMISKGSSLYDFFDRAREYRNTFNSRKSAVSHYEIGVDITDKPGAIAVIAVILSHNNINIKNIGIVNSRDYSEGVLQIIFNEKEDMEKAISILKSMNYKVFDK